MLAGAYGASDDRCKSVTVTDYGEHARQRASEGGKVAMGFEPMKNGFAIRPLGPLGHATRVLSMYSAGGRHPVADALGTLRAL